MISGVTTNGFSTFGNYTTVHCYSTHLTSFAVLVDVAGGLEVIKINLNCVQLYNMHGLYFI